MCKWRHIGHLIEHIAEKILTLLEIRNMIYYIYCIYYIYSIYYIYTTFNHINFCIVQNF